jgi:pimeloyl-ACP methyl ester carboxylesterase
VAANPGGSYGREETHLAQLLGRAAAGEGLEKEQVVFGEYVNGDLYLPAGSRASGRKSPAILWLHPFSFSNGYVAGYRRGEQPFRTLARAGYAVFCYDQVGHGARIHEVEGFYGRYPRWSLMGKMVRDAQAALDVLAARPEVDAARIWVVGYGLGSMVALHLGALDERPAGFALVAGAAPFRAPGGHVLRRWSRDHMLLPRLGLFAAEPERLPYDTPLLLACLAPRPTLVLSPQLDWESPAAEVTRGVELARQVYALHGAKEALAHLAPEDYNHFDPRMQGRVIEWLRGRSPTG